MEYVTKSGRVLSDEDIDRLVTEAEAGYDLDGLEQVVLGADGVHRRRWFSCPRCGDLAERYAEAAGFENVEECTNPECTYVKPATD